MALGTLVGSKCTFVSKSSSTAKQTVIGCVCITLNHRVICTGQALNHRVICTGQAGAGQAGAGQASVGQAGTGPSVTAKSLGG